AVAAPALDGWVAIVNDVSGLTRDPEMFRAASGAALCLMHMRGTPADMQSRAHYEDLHAEIEQELVEALERACAAGIPEERIALDPGLGFAKTAAQNRTLLRRLRELRNSAARWWSGPRASSSSEHRQVSRRRIGYSEAWPRR